MSPSPVDIAGQVFSRLTVLHPAPPAKGRTQWVCRCECGVVKPVYTKGLRNGTTKSCGCWNLEVVRARRLTHGQSSTRLYRIWQGMHERCRNRNVAAYPNYGGRGIYVTEVWADFESFYSWATQNGYTDTLDVDRINNDGPYDPDNCRWVTRKVNCNNMRKTVYVELDGERLPITIAADKYGVGVKAVRSRLKLGWSLEKSLRTPVKGRSDVTL